MSLVIPVPQVVAAQDYDPAHLTALSRAMASWFVRRDNSFFDVNDLMHKRSRADVEIASLHRFRTKHPEIPLTNKLVSAVFKRAIQTRHTDPEEMILPWNGRVLCLPGENRRVIFENGVVTVNSWTCPAYRALVVEPVNRTIADDFFEWIFPREQERAMFLNWLAWCLQNEADKPTWAPFLYSTRMGCGKSALARLLVRLFGEGNSITQNNVDKLAGRFNLPLLQSKFVVCEEVSLRPGGGEANALKTYITERSAAAEAKGRDIERVEQRVCFLLTSNHLPMWIEPEDRRYYIIEVDHDGYARGPRADEFSSLVGRLVDWSNDDRNVAQLYRTLLARQLPQEFSAKTLNVARDGTAIMERIFGNGRDTVLDQLREQLDETGAHAVPERDVVQLVAELGGRANSTRHLMSDLGWSKREVKWGGVDYTRQLWVRPGYIVEQGTLTGPDRAQVSLVEHLAVFDRPQFGM